MINEVVVRYYKTCSEADDGGGDAGSMLPLFTLPLLVLQLLHPEAERVHGEGEDDRGALLG